MTLHILELPDDIILRIFSSLSSFQIYEVSKTCTRFEKIAKDKSLWNYADFTDGCLPITELKKVINNFLRPSTTQIRIRGFIRLYAGVPKWKTTVISPDMIQMIGEKCPKLRKFYLTEAAVDATKFKMVDFAAIRSIHELHIVDCHFYKLPSALSDGSYFKKSHNYLPHLETLEISSCNWVDDYDLMVLSKMDQIKSLILKNNIKIGIVMAYLVISFRFGFKNMEEIDLRGTSIKTSDIASVLQCGKLKALYLGPIGKTKRMNDESLYDMSLVMPDPRYVKQQPQQVVVLNIGPNGPSWKQVNDDELIDMGLDWVRNASRRMGEHNVEEEDMHYFVGRDGRPVEQENRIHQLGFEEDMESIDQQTENEESSHEKQENLFENEESTHEKNNPECNNKDTDNTEDIKNNSNIHKENLFKNTSKNGQPSLNNFKGTKRKIEHEHSGQQTKKQLKTHAIDYPSDPSVGCLSGTKDTKKYSIETSNSDEHSNEPSKSNNEHSLSSGNTNNKSSTALNNASDCLPGPSNANDCSPVPSNANNDCSPGPSNANDCSPGPSNANDCSPGPSNANDCLPGPSNANNDCSPGPSKANDCTPGPSNSNHIQNTEKQNLQKRLRQSPIPDKELTDDIADALGKFTKQLEHLVVRGCAITDTGLRNILNNVPTLRYLDVRDTFVTYSGVCEAQVARPDCELWSNFTKMQYR